MLAAIALALLGTRCADGFREDEMDCEQAVAHLKSCCSEIDVAQTACTHESTGGVVTSTALTADESTCILGEGCDTLRSSGVCDRSHDLPYTGSGTAPKVCP
jgi:hypothetical protein